MMSKTKCERLIILRFTECAATPGKKNPCKMLKGTCSEEDCPRGEEKIPEGCGGTESCGCCLKKCEDDGCTDMGGHVAYSKHQCEKGETPTKDYTSGRSECLCCLPNDDGSGSGSSSRVKCLTTLFKELAYIMHTMSEYVSKYDLGEEYSDYIETFVKTIKALSEKLKNYMSQENSQECEAESYEVYGEKKPAKMCIRDLFLKFHSVIGDIMKVLSDYGLYESFSDYVESCEMSIESLEIKLKEVMSEHEGKECQDDNSDNQNIETFLRKLYGKFKYFMDYVKKYLTRYDLDAEMSELLFKVGKAIDHVIEKIKGMNNYQRNYGSRGSKRCPGEVIHKLRPLKDMFIKYLSKYEINDKLQHHLSTFKNSLETLAKNLMYALNESEDQGCEESQEKSLAMYGYGETEKGSGSCIKIVLEKLSCIMDYLTDYITENDLGDELLGNVKSVKNSMDMIEKELKNIIKDYDRQQCDDSNYMDKDGEALLKEFYDKFQYLLKHIKEYISNNKGDEELMKDIHMIQNGIDLLINKITEALTGNENSGNYGASEKCLSKIIYKFRYLVRDIMQYFVKSQHNEALTEYVDGLEKSIDMAMRHIMAIISNFDEEGCDYEE